MNGSGAQPVDAVGVADRRRLSPLVSNQRRMRASTPVASRPARLAACTSRIQRRGTFRGRRLSRGSAGLQASPCLHIRTGHSSGCRPTPAPGYFGAARRQRRPQIVLDAALGDDRAARRGMRHAGLRLQRDRQRRADRQCARIASGTSMVCARSLDTKPSDSGAPPSGISHSSPTRPSGSAGDGTGIIVTRLPAPASTAASQPVLPSSRASTTTGFGCSVRRLDRLRRDHHGRCDRSGLRHRAQAPRRPPARPQSPRRPWRRARTTRAAPAARARLQPADQPKRVRRRGHRCAGTGTGAISAISRGEPLLPRGDEVGKRRLGRDPRLAAAALVRRLARPARTRPPAGRRPAGPGRTVRNRARACSLLQARRAVASGRAVSSS